MLPELERWVSYAVGGSSVTLVAFLVVWLVRSVNTSATARVSDALRIADERSDQLEAERADHAEDRQRFRDDVVSMRADLELERQRCDRLAAEVARQGATMQTLMRLLREHGIEWPG